jgi:agmatine deiminase
MTAPAWRLPAEWEPHAATWLAWPHNRRDWPGKFSPIPWVYAEIIRHLARHEPVDLIVQDPTAQARVRRLLARAGAPSGNVRFRPWPTDRIWVRDSGCTFVRGAAGVGAVLWRFNAWARYPDHQRDAEIGRRMAEAGGAEAVPAGHGGRPVVLEGGAIDGNGRGTLLTTEECLLSEVQQRNPGFGPEDYEQVFARHLGVTRVVWLEGGITGDDTHGHVDDVARFVAPDTVVAAVEADPARPNHAVLRENLRRLRAARDQDGRPLRVLELPLPAPVSFGGITLPASYTNFYIANGLVLVPVFNDPNDRIALNLFTDLFPDREVTGVYAGDLVLGRGTLHCLTQQQPSPGA